MDWLGIHFLTDLQQSGLSPVEHDHTSLLVVFSYLIASAAGYTALSLADVAVADDRRTRMLWRWIGAFCLGGGIWSMHFLAMMAFVMPIPVSYDHRLTALSLVIAIMASLLAMIMIGRPALTARQYIGAAICIGLGVTAMHYIGMAAMQSAATAYYDPWLFTLSILVSMLASLGSMMLIMKLRKPDAPAPLKLKIAASLALGAGIISMHFSGMAAVTFALPADLPFDPALHTDSHSPYLGIATAFISLIIIGCSLIAVWAGKKLESQRQDLERVNALLYELDSTQASLHSIAHFDALTGLNNRYSFNKELQTRLAEHASQGTSMALLFLDLDNFKRINDSLGHDAGDELLRVVAQRLKSALRERDLIARLGGDEFCILANLEENYEAELLGRRMLLKMKEPIILAGRKMVITTSIGASLFPQDAATTEELMKHADLALYKSKANGRNMLYFFQEQLKSKASLELKIEEELRQALSRNNLTVYYQPVFDLATRKVCHVEALVRWEHPEQGLLLPGSFIDIARANGFITDVDRWVIRKACRDIKKLHRQGFKIGVAVNCCVRSLERETLIAEVQEALDQAHLEAKYLELEVTENALMANVSQVVEQLNQLRTLGVRLSIDDFGTGYSSLAYLSQLPLDAIKVDRSFIQNIPHDARDIDLAEAIIAMGHKLHLKVIAEGVETQQQIDFLIENQCDLAQGFLPSRPLPFEKLRSFLIDEGGNNALCQSHLA
ncbi:putative bifunctional diguanylate cyclase/phosphodiesterase [Pseudomonas asuensis]|uniref:Signaling protein n=1 Tax=Pseudomonas asuensis TaxID=1825787 RepID=A0ABQ2GL14_9PSED|nr:bifunctional diguanylate cyclase/phosphodiesterase [Pseudomonas asuensis]GGM00322.1 putative signaling protein [Pseudomonas asuensis]